MLNGDTSIAPSTLTASIAATIWSPVTSGPIESADPRAPGVVSFVGMNLGIQYRHGVLHGTGRCADMLMLPADLPSAGARSDGVALSSFDG
jgi:hypothetical protein